MHSPYADATNHNRSPMHGATPPFHGFPPFGLPPHMLPPFGFPPGLHHHHHHHHGTPTRLPMTPMRNNTPMTTGKPLSGTPHQPRVAGATAKAESPCKPQFREHHLRRKLADMLEGATHQELVDLLVDVSYFDERAREYIECKGQALSLRPPQQYADPVAATPEPTVADTPVKQVGPENSEVTPVKPSQRTGAALVPQSPADATKERGSPESMPFCQDRHPCIWIHGSCRIPRSCPFARCPQNLCMAWVRGHCPNGHSCSLVHRLPADASQALRHLHEVSVARRDECDE